VEKSRAGGDSRVGCRIEGRVGIPGRGPFIPLFRRSRPPPSSERYPSEARRRPRGAATGSRGSTFPKEDEGRAILKRRRVKQRDRGRKRERERERREERGLFSFSLASFLPSPAAHPSIDRRTLLRAAFVSSPPAAFVSLLYPQNLLAMPTQREYLMPGERLTA